MHFKHAALAFALLATSAIVSASSSEPSTSELKTTITAVKDLIKEGKIELSEEKIKELNLTEAQVNALKGITDFSEENIEAALKPKDAASDSKSLEQQIFDQVKEKKLTKEALKEFNLDNAKVEALVNGSFETFEDVKKVLDAAVDSGKKDSPKASTTDLLPATVENVKKCVNGDDKFDTEELKKVNLTDAQRAALLDADFVINDENIKKILETENKPSEPSADSELKTIVAAVKDLVKEGKLELSEEKIKELNLTEAQVNALKGITDFSEENIEAALKPKDAASDSKSLEQQIFAKVNDKKFTKEALAAFNLDNAKVEALVNGSFETVEDVKKVLDAAVDSNKKESSKDSTTELLLANIENVKKCVNGDGKFDTEGLKKVNLTDAQRAALLDADFVINDENIKKILETEKSIPSELQTEAEFKATANALKALVNEEKLVLTAEKIKELKLNEAQVKALKETKDLSETNIAKILKDNSTQISKPAEESKWYTSSLFLISCGALALLALGGGAYYMTNKSDETDL